jgi:ribose 5-phosphate isomerase A
MHHKTDRERRAVKTTESRLSDSNRSSHTKKMVTATASTPFSLSSSVVFTRRRNFKRFPVCASLSPEVSPLLRAAHHTVDNYVKSGMIIGLGSGEASDFAIRYLGQQLGSGSLHNVVGVPMSARSASEAAKYGIPLEYYRDGVQIDFAFHDADAVEENTLIAVIGRRRSSQEDDYILKQKVYAVSCTFCSL